MGDIRKNLPAKVIASLLFLVSVFGLCWQGLSLLEEIDYVMTDSWQDTAEYTDLIRAREDQLAEWFAAEAALEGPDLAYLDQVRYETAAEQMGTAMAREHTFFRYRVLNHQSGAGGVPGAAGAEDPLRGVPAGGAPDPVLEQRI